MGIGGERGGGGDGLDDYFIDMESHWPSVAQQDASIHWQRVNALNPFLVGGALLS